MQSWLKSRGLYGGSTFCRGCYSGVLPLVGGRWCWPGVWVQLVLLEVAGLIQRFYEHEAVFIDTEGGVACGVHGRVVQSVVGIDHQDSARLEPWQLAQAACDTGLFSPAVLKNLPVGIHGGVVLEISEQV